MDRPRALRLVGAVLIAVGALATLVAIAEGQAQVVLVLIFPVIYGTGPLAALAILTIFLGFALLFFSFFEVVPAERGTVEQEEAKKGEFGGVVLIGPIPIVFGSAKALKGKWTMVALAAVGLAILVLFLILTFRP